MARTIPRRITQVLLIALTLVVLILQAGVPATISSSSSPSSPAASQPSVPTVTSPITTAWQTIGPRPIATHTSTDYGVPPFSGRVTSLALDPSNGAIMYVGSAGGGVWQTTNCCSSTMTWVPTSDYQSTLSIGALAVASNGNVYAGTGEPNHAGDAFVGSGLMVGVPTSAGVPAWSLVGQSVFAGSAISGIVVSSTNPNVILVSTTFGTCCKALGPGAYNTVAGMGIFNGTITCASSVCTGTFTKVLDATPGGGISSLVQDPSNPNNVYAGAFNGQVWQSTHFGTMGTWSLITALSQTTASNEGRVALAISQGSPGILYAAFSNAGGGLEQCPLTAPGSKTCVAAGTTCTTTPNCGPIVAYSTTAKTAKILGVPPSITRSGGTYSACGGFGEVASLGGGSGQCYYDLVLAVDPVKTTPPTLFFGGTDLYWSKNGGNSWTPEGGYDIGTDVHPDQHALIFSSSGTSSTLYIGNDGGVWSQASSSFGDIHGFVNLNSDLDLTQFYSIGGYPNPSGANGACKSLIGTTSAGCEIGGVQDDGCVDYTPTSTNPEAWNQLVTGDGAWAGFGYAASLSPHLILYCEEDYSSTGFSFYYSLDNGSTFQPSVGLGNLSLLCSCSAPHDTGVFAPPVTQDPDASGTLYVGGQYIWRTTTYGLPPCLCSAPNTDAWSDSDNISADQGVSLHITALAVAPSENSTVYAGTTVGSLWETTWNSAGWQKTTQVCPSCGFPSSAITSIAVSPLNPNLLYVSFVKYNTPVLWAVDAATNSAQQITFPTSIAESINAVALTLGVTSTTSSPSSSLLAIFIGTDAGVYWSSDGGSTWASVGTDLPNSPVFDLQINSANDLVAGTFGRGVWYLPLGQWAASYALTSGTGSAQINSVIQTTDGGFLAVGTTTTSTGHAFLVMKLDPTGDLVWMRTYTGGGDDEARSAAQSPDGDYVVAGYSNSFSGTGNYQMLVMKLDRFGNVLWQTALGDPSSNAYAYSVVAESPSKLDTSPAYIVAGSISYLVGTTHGWVVKLNPADGSIVWQNLYTGGCGLTTSCENEQISSIITWSTSTGFGYATVGWSGTSTAPSHIWVMNLTSAGAMNWSDKFCGTCTAAGVYELGVSLVQTPSGNVAVAGYASIPSGGNPYLVLMVSPAGKLVWARAYAGIATGDVSYAKSITNGPSKSIVMTGFTLSYPAGTSTANMLVLQISDSTGNIIQNETFGVPNGGGGLGLSITQAFDGSLVMAGSTSISGTQAWILRLSPTLQIPGCNCEATPSLPATLVSAESLLSLQEPSMTATTQCPSASSGVVCPSPPIVTVTNPWMLTPVVNVQCNEPGD